MSSTCSPTYIAAVGRAEYVALAVFRGRQLIELRQHRLKVRQRTPQHLGLLVSNLALDYGVQHLIVEPDSVLARAELGTAFQVTHCEIRQGRRWLLGATTVYSERDLCRELVLRYPELGRFVTVYPRTGNVAQERWKITQLFAVALGLNHAEKLSSSSAQPRSSPFISSSSFYVQSTQPRVQRHTDQVGKTAVRTP